MITEKEDWPDDNSPLVKAAADFASKQHEELTEQWMECFGDFIHGALWLKHRMAGDHAGLIAAGRRPANPP